MIEATIDTFPNCGRFFAMISRGLANEQHPSKERLRSAWARVAFTNYVSVTVGEWWRTRPNAEMWLQAKSSFLQDLSIVEPIPRRIVILGRSIWANMPDTQVYITDDVQGYRVADETVMCCAVEHPAGGLSWRKLAGVIHFTYENELRG